MADEDFLIRLRLDLGDANSSINALQGNVKRLNDELDRTSRTNGASALNKEADAARSAKKAADDHASSLSTTRYALLGVSLGLATTGTALLGIAAGTYAVSIAWERDFANVVRTSGVAGDAVQELRSQFIDLQQTIPVAANDLAEIGALGGQLGIAANDLVEFTSVVARFSATTNLTVDASATAFGRLNALLPDVGGNFESLADSILNVGVNSVATESSITAVAVQISSMGNYAGLTSKEVIGLAGALASIGVAPELARGTITRTFTLIGKAVSGGGEELEKFAKIAGVSSEEFGNAFGTDKFGPIFLKFVNGLDSISASGGDTVKALNDLGITSVRDVPALLRLATAANSAGEAGKILNQTLSDASVEKSAGATIEQYGIIAATVAAKIQLLQNNFNALLVTIGGGGSIFGGLLDALNGVLQTLTDIASNPVGNFFLQLGVILTGVIGVLALVGAAMALSYAGVIGLTQALVGMSASAIGGHVSLSSLLVTMRATGPAGATAATGINLVSKALRLLALVGFVELANEGIKGIISLEDQFYDSTHGIGNSLDDVIDRLSDSRFEKAIAGLVDGGLDSWAKDVERSFANIGYTGISQLTDDLKELDDSLAATVKSGNLQEAQDIIDKLASGAGVTSDEYLTRLPETLKAIGLAGEGAKPGLDAVAQGAADAEAATEELAASLGLTAEELKSFKDAIVEGGTGFVELGDLIQRNQDQTRGWAEETSKDLYGSKDSWQEFYDGVSINLQKFNEDLSNQIIALDNWQKNLSILVGRGVDEGVIAQLARMGPEAAPLLQALVDDTTGTAQQVLANLSMAGEESVQGFADNVTANTPLLRAAFAAGGDEAVKALSTALGRGDAEIARVMAQYNIVAAQNPIQITAAINRKQIGDAINSVINWIGGAKATIPLSANGTPYLPSPVTRAEGGAVFGPGTPTSDSIPARLSNGEYVIRAASVRKYGMGMFDQLNRGVAKFSRGGPVQRFAGGGAVSPMSLSPRQLRDAPTGDILVMLDGEVIARAVNKANARAGSTGNN